MPDVGNVWDLHAHSDKNVQSGAQMREYERVANRIAADYPAGNVLDWGSGFGQMSELLLRRRLDPQPLADPDLVLGQGLGAADEVGAAIAAGIVYLLVRRRRTPRPAVD